MSQIILDEQIRPRVVLVSLRSWITVSRVLELRPNTIIKDEAIPGLLRQLKQPTFVTINVRDFWKRKLCDPRYCIVCMAVADDKQFEIPRLLRDLLRLPEFKTHATRMGKIAHVGLEHRRYYRYGDDSVHQL